ncbi:MAG: sulfatase [Pirellulaceae bacterium]|nr:sulfatase [Pirellulaceae bacterium]
MRNDLVLTGKFPLRALVLALALSAALSVGKRDARADAAPRRPNLLIIHTDEHNFRTLGCYRATLPPEQALMWGEAVVETPHIDSIAQRGALCTSFYATTPVCSPSRSSFVSGRYPHNTPVYTNDIAMSDQIVTFAEILRRVGYSTGYLGKWHLDGTGKPQWAPERKFGFEDNRYMFNRGHWKQLEDTAAGPRVKATNAAGEPTYDVAGADEQSFATDFLADRTVEFIRAHRDRPFCLMLSLPDPHGPDTVRPPYDTMFQHQTYRQPRSALKTDDGLPTWGQKQQGGFNQAAYYGMVKCIDDNVGKILDALHQTGLSEQTIVVFTSDHGDLRGEHHRQNKGVPYEGSAKVPFVIAYPGKIQPGTIVHEALGCVDFHPTILGLMQVAATGEVEGRDASSLLTAGRAPADWKDIAILRGTGLEHGWLAAVTKRYKLVVSTSDEPWLFDLENDPDELVNRFRDSAYRRTVRELGQELAAYGQRFSDPRAANAMIQADLAWAVSGTGDYVSDRPARPPQAKAAKAAKEKPKKRKQAAESSESAQP